MHGIPDAIVYIKRAKCFRIENGTNGDVEKKNKKNFCVCVCASNTIFKWRKFKDEQKKAYKNLSNDNTLFIVKHAS